MSSWKDSLLGSLSRVLRDGTDDRAAADKSAGPPAAQQFSVELLSSELARARRDLGAGHAEDVIVGLRQSLENLGLVTAATWAVLSQAYERLERDKERAGAYRRAVDTYAATSAIRGADGTTAIAPALVALGRRPAAVHLLEDSGLRYRVIVGIALLESGAPDAAIDVLRPAAQKLPSDDEAQVFLAEALRRTQSADAALVVIEPFLESKPDDADALLVRAQIRRSRGELDKALADLERSLEVHPDFTAARSERVDLALAAGRASDTVNDLTILATQLPGEAFIAVTLARVLAETGDPLRSVAEFDRALALDPTLASAHSGRATQLLSLGRGEDALRAFERAIELDPSNVPTRISYIDALRSAGKLDKATDLVDALIQERPDDPVVIGTRGQVYEAQNERAKAVQDFRAALILDPDLAWVLAGLARTLFFMDQFADARTAVDRLIAVAPDIPDAHILRSRILQSLGELPGALEEIDLALALVPTGGAAHYTRGLLLIQLGRPEEALAAFDAIAPNDPEVASSLLNTWRGDTLRLLGRSQDAGACYELALQVDPANSTALMGRGRVRYEAADFESAAKDFQEAADVAATTNDPEARASALTLLGETRRRMGQFAEAVDALDQALELDPGFADALATRGQVHAGLGQRSEAIRDLEDAIAQKPDLAWAQADLAEQFRLEGRLEEALSALNKAQKGGLDTAFVHGTRGQVLLELQRVDDAKVELRQAWSIEPAAWIADELAKLFSSSTKEADWDEALTVLDAALEASPEARILLRRKADVLRIAGRSTDGLVAIAAYLVDQPDDQVALATRAHLLVDTGASNEALELARELERRDPADLSANYAAVRALTGLDRHSDALSLLDELIKKNASEEWLKLMRASVLCELRFLTEALRSLGPLLEANPEDSFGNAMKGYCERRLEPPELVTAIGHYRQALLGEPDNLSYQVEFADALRTNGDDEATTWYHSVLETAGATKSPTSTSMVLAAWAAMRLGRPDEAVTQLQDAIQIDSFALSYRFGLGLAQLHAARGELAVDEYEGASSLAMKRPDPFRAASVLTEALNDLREDRAAFPESVREDYQEAETALVDALTQVRAALPPKSPAAPGVSSADDDSAPATPTGGT